MRSTWPALVAVVAVGTGIGISIGGLPASRASDVTLPAAPSTTVFIAPSETPPQVIDTTPVPTTVASTTAETTTVAPTTEAPPTTAAPTTEAPPTSTEPPAPTTEVPAPTTVAPVAEVLDRADVRLVVANGDGRFNLVGRNVDRLLALGYVTIDQTDVPESQWVDRTVIWFRDGFDDEAARLAVDLQVPGALVQPLGTATVTADDANGDLIAVLGPDAVR